MQRDIFACLLHDKSSLLSTHSICLFWLSSVQENESTNVDFSNKYYEHEQLSYHYVELILEQKGQRYI